jgi:hypothetical protein
MHRSLVLLGLCFVVAVLSDAAGCSASQRNQFSSGAGGGATGTGSTSASGPGSGGSSLSGLGTGGGSCSGGGHCSSDLHSLVDCNGNVLMTCPADEGCSGTGCVPACQAAQDDKSSLGCEYYAVDPATDGPFNGQGGCFVSYVANTWTTPVTLSVNFGATVLDPSKFAYTTTGAGPGIVFTPLSGGVIPAGQVAVLFLADLPGATDGVSATTCPASVSTAVTNVDAATHGTAIGTAFHLTVTAPVAAFDIFPYGGGSAAMTSATLLLPTSAWDTNYVVVSAFGPGLVIEDLPFLAVVAQENDTRVTINPVADLVAGTGVAAGPAGMPTTYTIQQGQVLQFAQAAPLDGSILQSNNPVGVWGGKTAVSIVACCDESAHQQIPPVRALGSEYVGVRYRNRYAGIEESPPWRILGAANGTTLTWEPAVPVGAPTSLSLGQLVTFSTNGPFVVRSQDATHPFYMSAHMTGGALYDPSQQTPCSDAPADGRGDAEFVNVIPPDEYLSSYVFFTDPTYPETDLVIVRTKGPQGFEDVTLDCAGTLGSWLPAGTSGKYEYTRFDLVTGNFVGTGSCNNGRHEMKSTAPFGVTVWGWGSAATGEMFMGFYSQYVSYAYPAGAGVAPINQVVVPAIPE